MPLLPLPHYSLCRCHRCCRVLVMSPCHVRCHHCHHHRMLVVSPCRVAAAATAAACSSCRLVMFAAATATTTCLSCHLVVLLPPLRARRVALSCSLPPPHARHVAMSCPLPPRAHCVATACLLCRHRRCMLVVLPPSPPVRCLSCHRQAVACLATLCCCPPRRRCRLRPACRVAVGVKNKTK